MPISRIEVFTVLISFLIGTLCGFYFYTQSATSMYRKFQKCFPGPYSASNMGTYKNWTVCLIDENRQCCVKKTAEGRSRRVKINELNFGVHDQAFVSLRRRQPFEYILLMIPDKVEPGRVQVPPRIPNEYPTFLLSECGLPLY